MARCGKERLPERNVLDKGGRMFVLFGVWGLGLLLSCEKENKTNPVKVGPMDAPRTFTASSTMCINHVYSPDARSCVEGLPTGHEDLGIVVHGAINALRTRIPFRPAPFLLCGVHVSCMYRGDTGRIDYQVRELLRVSMYAVPSCSIDSDPLRCSSGFHAAYSPTGSPPSPP